MSEGDKDSKQNRSVVERRQAFAERQAARGKGLFSGQKVMGHGPVNRHGMPKVPVEQRVVSHWPVLDLGDHPVIDLKAWRLEIDGLVDMPCVYTWEDFLKLPQVEDESDFHCVTGWSRMDNRWKGVQFSVIAKLAMPRAGARFVHITAYDQAPGSDIPYTTNLSLEEAMQPDVMLVHTWEGKPLPREHGGPLRMITPQLYAWKGAKWIRRITFCERDVLGFWEVRGYSATAYPWYNDRFSR